MMAFRWAQLLVCFVVLGVIPTSRAADTQAPVRIQQSLNAGWLFQRQANGSGALGSFDRDTASASVVEPQFRDAYLPDYDDAAWQRISLPHTWNALDTTDAQAGYWRGIGWYRRHFRVDAKYAGKRIVLRFAGVNQTAEVWLNGKLLGVHQGGYTGFSFVITPHFHEDNVLTVKVDNLYNANVPPTVKTDLNFYGGIYRSVSLLITNPTFVSDMYWTTPDVSAASAQVEFHSSITNQTAVTKHLMLIQQVLDPKGTVASTTMQPVLAGAGETKELVQRSGVLAHPELWSPDTPNLYRIQTVLMEGAQVLDVMETPLGFRWYHFDPQRGFFLNGKRVQIRGTNLHQSYPGMGNAVPASRAVKDMEIVRDMGANFWRTSHYPHDEATMDASDRLGLMVWEELPIMKEIGDPERYIRNVSSMAQEMIARDRNHPSVILWGIAGEINAPENVSVQVVGAIAKLYRQMDPTRLVGMHSPRSEQVAALADVVGADAGPATDREHAQHPQRAFMTAEYSVALIGRGLYGKGKYTEDNGLAQHEAYLRELHKRPWMAGGCIWNEFDYDGETYDPVIPHIVSFGMTDIWRIPKEVYYFYQSQWAKQSMVHIVGHWTWPGEEGRPRTVTVLSNQEAVELFLNGKSLGVKKDLSGSGLQHPPRTWQVPYEPGTLKAVARSGGHEISDVVRTAGPAFKIVLRSDTYALRSGDPDSLAYITALVTDANGVVVPGAHPAVTFTSYGPGRLREQSWLGHDAKLLTWNAIDGKTRVAFQATDRSGRAVVSAYSPGLRTAQIAIDITAPGKPDEMNYKDLAAKDELSKQN